MSPQPSEITTPADGPCRTSGAPVPLPQAAETGEALSASTPPVAVTWPSGRHRTTRSQSLRVALPGPGRGSGGHRRASHKTDRRSAARAVAGWASATGDTLPEIGARRRPGTLPIESWLLLGRHRQQALLAAIVAAGLILVTIPTQQQETTDIQAVNASQRGAAAAAAAANGGGVPPGAGKVIKPTQRDDGAAKPAAPSTSTPGRPTTVEPAPKLPSTPPDGVPSTPAEDIPSPPVTTAPDQSAASLDRRGSGPARSLRRTGTSTVALTFDDGPDPVQTPKLLDLLQKNGVTATFCLVGKQVNAHPEIVRRIVADGHKLCNHSWNHSFTLGKQDPKDISEDLSKTNEAIRLAVPDAPIPYFRAPGGNFTDALVGTADKLGMTSLYWEVDPRDWEQPEDEDDTEHVDRIVAQVKQQVRNGSIVLSHDFDQPQTIVAYETLLPWLKERFTLGLP